MIKNTTPLSMSEATTYLKGAKDDGKEMKGFIKKFTKLKAADSKKLREKIKEMNIIQINDIHISKIIDVLPENTEELNKIFVGVGLTDEESKGILEAVKEFK